MHQIVVWPAVAVGGLGLVISGCICVPDLEIVPAKASEAVAPLRARAGRGRGRVQEEVHAVVAVEIGDDDLPRVGEIGVRLGVAREARVGLGIGGLGQAAAVIATVVGAPAHGTIWNALEI